MIINIHFGVNYPVRPIHTKDINFKVLIIILTL